MNSPGDHGELEQAAARRSKQGSAATRQQDPIRVHSQPHHVVVSESAPHERGRAQRLACVFDGVMLEQQLQVRARDLRERQLR